MRVHVVIAPDVSLDRALVLFTIHRLARIKKLKT